MQQALCIRCIQHDDNAAGEIDGRRAVGAGRSKHLSGRQPQRFRKMIGEAATQVSPALKARDAKLPWRQITALRNVVSHAYFQLHLEMIREVAIQEVPPLKEQIEQMLRELEP